MVRMRRRFRLVIAFGLVAATCLLTAPQVAAAPSAVAAKPAAAVAAAAAVTEGVDCHEGAFGSGTVVHICASIHYEPFRTPTLGRGYVRAAGAARHTKGPGPVYLYITALQLWDATQNKLLRADGRNFGVDYVSEEGADFFCGLLGVPSRVTFQTRFGIDAYLPGQTKPTHITQYSKKVTHAYCGPYTGP